MSIASDSSALGNTGSALNKPDQIADRVRELITRGALAPGVHLGQTELAEMFGASRVPVREALKLLASEGIIVHDPNRGFFVALMSSDEARQLYKIRHLLEAEILSTVNWPNQLQLKNFRRQVDQIEECRHNGHTTEWAVLHRAFHRAVFELSNEKILVREALRLWGLADRYRSLLATTSEPNYQRKGKSSDRQLLEALSEKDRERLLAVFHEVRTGLLDALIDILHARGL